MHSPVLTVSNLSKRFGRIRAVNELSIEVGRGSVYGILGPNGSGKTTTLGIVTGVVHATSGTYAWFGQAPSKESRRKIGAIVETPVFYPYLSGYRNLQVVADIKGVDHSGIGDMLAFVGLQGREGDRYRTYSLGMKQRLAIASALLNAPQVLILDEPTNGLDPQGIAEVRNLIRKVAAQGTTIILASHLLDEVEKVCSHVAILKQGSIRLAGELRDLVTPQRSLEDLFLELFRES